MIRNLFFSLCMGFGLLGLMSCTLGPDYKRPPVVVPQKWSEVAGSEKTDTEWWARFNDATLTSLIHQVMQQNFDLKAAEQALLKNQALLQKSHTDLWPAFTASGSFSANKSAPNYYDTISGETRYHLYTAQVGVSWEIDLFGRLRRLKEAASADFQAQMDECYEVFLSLVAQTAETYVRLRSAQQQLKIVEALLECATTIYQLTLDTYVNGLRDQRAVDDAKSVVLRYEAQAAPLRAAIAAHIHGLSLLTSQAPQALNTLLKKEGAIPQVPPQIFVGLPAQVVERRPDIRKAEMALASSTAHIGVAKSQWFPIFSLVGQTGYQSTHSHNLISPDSTFYSAGPMISWNIFDFGRVKAQVLASEAARDQMYFSYMQTVLKALSEVESGLISYAHGLKHSEDIRASMQAKENMATLTHHRYEAGLDSQIDWLNTRMSALNAGLDEVLSQETLAIDVITLYKALGGGWDVYHNYKRKMLSS